MNPNEGKPPRTLFYLPQLPKADYKLLEALRKRHSATQLEVLMVGLHALAAMRPWQRKKLLDAFRATAPTDQAATINEDHSTDDERCPYCSFHPVNRNDYCDTHRPASI